MFVFLLGPGWYYDRIFPEGAGSVFSHPLAYKLAWVLQIRLWRAPASRFLLRNRGVTRVGEVGTTRCHAHDVSRKGASLIASAAVLEGGCHERFVLLLYVSVELAAFPYGCFESPGFCLFFERGFCPFIFLVFRYDRVFVGGFWVVGAAKICGTVCF